MGRVCVDAFDLKETDSPVPMSLSVTSSNSNNNKLISNFYNHTNDYYSDKEIHNEKLNKNRRLSLSRSSISSIYSINSNDNDNEHNFNYTYNYSLTPRSSSNSHIHHRNSFDFSTLYSINLRNKNELFSNDIDKEDDYGKEQKAQIGNNKPSQCVRFNINHSENFNNITIDRTAFTSLLTQRFIHDHIDGRNFEHVIEEQDEDDDEEVDEDEDEDDDDEEEDDDDFMEEVDNDEEEDDDEEDENDDAYHVIVDTHNDESDLHTNSDSENDNSLAYSSSNKKSKKSSKSKACSIYRCKSCSSDICHSSLINSKDFWGNNGLAYFVDNVINVRLDDQEVMKIMRTGEYGIKAIYCIQCNINLGWKYITSVSVHERYKVGKFVIEMNLLDDYKIPK